MSRLQLVDASMWIQTLRRNGDKAHQKVVTELTSQGLAAWCEPVRLELWSGVSSPQDRLILAAMYLDLPRLPMDESIWDLACQLADIGRKKGFQFPPADLLIFACAKQHQVPLLHRDAHFLTLEELWVLLSNAGTTN